MFELYATELVAPIRNESYLGTMGHSLLFLVKNEEREKESVLLPLVAKLSSR
jgi:hypothetical protein